MGEPNPESAAEKLGRRVVDEFGRSLFILAKQLARSEGCELREHDIVAATLHMFQEEFPQSINRLLDPHREPEHRVFQVSGGAN